MNITINITIHQATALKYTLQQCLHLSEKSPRIFDILGITPKDIERVGEVLTKLPNVRNIPEASGSFSLADKGVDNPPANSGTYQSGASHGGD